jgi:hypothetical protein
MMTEHFNEQISQFVDDEMSPEECEFFVRRLQNDPEARSCYLRYQLIGAVVRGECRHRPAVQAVRQGKPARSALVIGAGIAAGAALIAVVGFRLAGVDLSATAGGVGVTASNVTDAASPEAAPDDSRPAGPAPDDFGSAGSGPAIPADYVVPAAATEPRQLAAGVPTQVTSIQYLIHHTGYSSGLSRTIMHSSLLAGAEDDAATTSEAKPVD